MSFREGKNDYTKPGTIGDTIRKFRKIRNMSMKELGLKCGYTKVYAQARISQYESSRKIPSEETLKIIADALEVDAETFTNLGTLTEISLFKTLFEIESQCGLHPCLNNGKYGLEFDSKSEKASNPTTAINIFLKHWYNKYKECESLPSDSDNEKKYKQTEYEIWKGEFPKQSQKEIKTARKKEIQDKIASLQKELELIENDEY